MARPTLLQALWRWGARGLALCLLLPVGWFLAGFLGAVIPGPHARFDGQALIEIGVIDTAIHTDLLLPLNDELRRRFAFAAGAGVGVMHPDSGWLLVGWGAQDFYTSAGAYSDVPIGAVLRGIAGDRSVVRLEAWQDLPLDQLGARPLQLTEAGYRALLDRIVAELGPAPQLLAAPGLGRFDAFYRGTTPFNALMTCNVWMGQALRDAGVPLGIWVPTPQALQLSLALWN